MKEDSDLKSKLHLNTRKLKRNKIVRKKAHETYSKNPTILMLLRERRGPNLNGFQTFRCTMWEKRTPQTFYEKVPHLGQQKAKHLDSFLLLSQNTKSFALYIIARNSDILLLAYSLASHSMFSPST